METIKTRKNFDDIDVINTPYIDYLPYLEIPDCKDYKYGERRTIVLRNKMTGELERINYVLVGSVPSMTRKGYNLWYWGDIEADGAHCCLCFNFNINDKNAKCTHIHASFWGRSPSPKEFEEIETEGNYAAAFTANDCYFSNKRKTNKKEM